MQRIIMTVIAIAAIFSVKAQYVLTESKGNVRVESKGGTAKRLSRGMQLEGTDFLVLGAGAEAKILNKMRKEEYTTKSEGKASVLKRMVESRRKAGNKNEVIKEFAPTGGTSDANKKSYSHHGRVNRGSETSDGDISEITDIQLIAAMLRDWEYYTDSEMFLPITFNYVAGEDSSRLAINNQGTACYYFNVFRIDSNNDVSVETYVTDDPCLNNRVEGGEEWSMEWHPALTEGTHRVVVMSDAPYDIEEVLLELREGKDSYDDSQAVRRNKLLKVL